MTELKGEGQYEGRIMEVSFGKAKAVAAGVFGFLAPGATYLIGVSGDGITGNEWLVAGLICIGGAAAASGAVYAVRNKAIATDKGPA